MTTVEPLGPDQHNRLGCAQDYEAVVHFQGGKQVHTRLDGATEITWGRKLDDYSEASVTLAKRQLSEQCWRKIGGIWETREYPDENGVMRKWLHMVEPGVEPWMHELSIYRDKGLVWQGPIVEVIEKRDEGLIEINARDVLFWLDRRVLSLSIEQGGPYDNIPTGQLLARIMERTFPTRATGEPDWYHNPNLNDERPGGVRWRIDEDTPGKFTTTKPIWRGSRTVGDLVRDVIQNGIDMFTLGRKIYMIPDHDRSDPTQRAPYRLTDEHIMGDLEVHKLGLDLATEGFVSARPAYTCATNPPPPGQREQPPVYGNWPDGNYGTPNPGDEDGPTPAYYGRITRFTESQTVNQTPAEACRPDRKGEALINYAKAVRAYGFPCPRSLVLPQGAALAPDTPLHINQLVPGRTVRVETTNWVTPTTETYRINEVEVTWTSSGGESGATSSSGGSSTGSAGTSESNGPEQVRISLASLRNPPIDSTDTEGI